MQKVIIGIVLYYQEKKYVIVVCVHILQIGGYNHGRLNLGNSSKMIIFESLLTTFNISYVF